MKKILNHSKIANREYKMTTNEFENEPFFGTKNNFCDHCKILGYCVASKNMRTYVQSDFVRFTVKDYLDLVPVQIKGAQFGNYSKLHLQIAYDAFHQQDYETAILHFRAVVDVIGFNKEVTTSLVVANFMAKDYENALVFAEYLPDSDIIQALKEDIVKLSIEEAAQKEKAIISTEKAENEHHFNAIYDVSLALQER